MKRGKFWFVLKTNLSHNSFFSTAFTFGLLIALLSIITRQGDGQESSGGDLSSTLDPIFQGLQPFLIGILNLFGFGENSYLAALNSVGTDKADASAASPTPLLPDLLTPLLSQLFDNVPEPVLEEASCGCTSFILPPVYDPIRAILGPLDSLTAPLAVLLNALGPFLTPLTETINKLAPLAKVLGPLLCLLKPVIDFLASGILLLLEIPLPVLTNLALFIIVTLSPIIMLLVLLAAILQNPILAPLVQFLVTLLTGLLSTIDLQKLTDSISQPQ